MSAFIRGNTFYFVINQYLITSEKCSDAVIPDLICCADFASLPVLLYHFQQFSLLSIPLNMIFVLFIQQLSCLCPYSFFFLSIMYLPLGQALFQLLDSVIQLSHQLSAHMAVFDGFNLIFMKSTWWHILLEVSAIVFAIYDGVQNVCEILCCADFITHWCLECTISPRIFSKKEKSRCWMSDKGIVCLFSPLPKGTSTCGPGWRIIF
ncbi:ComEC/Rec2 family competence protein [Bacillus sp. SL00103]